MNVIFILDIAVTYLYSIANNIKLTNDGKYPKLKYWIVTIFRIKSNVIVAIFLCESNCMYLFTYKLNNIIEDSGSSFHIYL